MIQTIGHTGRAVAIMLPDVWTYRTCSGHYAPHDWAYRNCNDHYAPDVRTQEGTVAIMLPEFSGILSTTD
jgi:hypothetical protein